jgi:putative two-component system response regulator
VTGPGSAIVVIASEPGLGAVLEHVLGQAGLGPVQPAKPSHALEVVASSRPRLVLLDLELVDGDAPGGSPAGGTTGVDVLATLAPWVTADPPLPVIAVAPAGAADARRRARAAGARDFLTKPLDPTEVHARIENVLAAAALSAQGGAMSAELEQTRLESIERLARLAEYRDDATYEHPQRVGRTAALLAERLGLAPDVVEAIRGAAPLHDVGKVGVPDRILLKPSRLTAGEEIARTHHERWDGTGYPDGKLEDEIPISGRIVIVADNFDALTHSRPYAAAWDAERAAAEIRRQSGQHFDPQVVDAFDSLDLQFLLSPML